MECPLYLCTFAVIFAGLRPLTVTSKCIYPAEIFGVLFEGLDDTADNPSNETFIPSLDVPRDLNLRHTSRRLRTYFLAPESGTYRFYLACDDSCTLKLSTDEKLENLVLLVNIARYIGYKNWKRSNSKEVSLSRGRSYLLEAILVQGNGLYHMTVGVRLPDGNYSRPVSSEFLVKYAPGKFGDAPMGAWGAWSQCSRTCGEGTQLRHRRSCLNPPPVYRNERNATEKRVCQHEKPCSESCRCPQTLFVNWMQASPLCLKNNDANGITPAGMIPDLLPDMIAYACGTCHEHKRTAIVFKEEKASIHNITSTLSAHTQLNLPISMAPNMPFVREEWVFLPVVEVVGIAFLMRKPTIGVYAKQLGTSVQQRWPLVLTMFVLYFVFGLAVWNAEKHVNSAHFSPRFTQGWSQGLWSAFVSMTTVGYGDHYAISVPGRLLCIASILVGIIMNALFIALVTTSLTVFVIKEAANPEGGSKIGIVRGSVEQTLGMRINGTKGIRIISFPTKDAVLQGLKSGTLDGALIDTLTVDPFIKELDDSEFEVAKTLPSRLYYGIILTGDARYLLKDFKEYLASIPIEKLSKQMKRETQDGISRETKPTESTQEVVTVIPFFEPRYVLFRRTVKITGIALLLGLVCGLFYQLIRKRVRLKYRRDPTRDPRQELATIKAEMTQLVNEFHNRIKQRYCALKIKHKRQLLQLRERRRATIVTLSYRNRDSSAVEQRV